MTFMAFLSAVLALLLAPGPTNTLVGLAGAASGPRGAARLLPAEAAGYLTAILPLAWSGGRVLHQWPWMAAGIEIAAALWVMGLAIRLWARRAGAVGAEVTMRQVYTTTLLNPKALVFGLVLIPPPGDPQFLPRLGAFGLMVLAAGVVWGGAGALTRLASGSDARVMVMQRAAAGWLALVALTLVGGAVA